MGFWFIFWLVVMGYVAVAIRLAPQFAQQQYEDGLSQWPRSYETPDDRRRMRAEASGEGLFMAAFWIFVLPWQVISHSVTKRSFPEDVALEEELRRAEVREEIERLRKKAAES